jgi:hypothetical protein
MALLYCRLLSQTDKSSNRDLPILFFSRLEASFLSQRVVALLGFAYRAYFGEIHAKGERTGQSQMEESLASIRRRNFQPLHFAGIHCVFNRHSPLRIGVNDPGRFAVHVKLVICIWF